MSRPIADLYGADAAEDPLIAEFDGARQLTLGGEWREGLAKLEALAHRGSILSMLFVAGAMLEGWGYDQDLPGAGAWYDVAAQSGFTAGLFGLALTEIRMGCPRKAVQKLEAAISKNYPPAYNALAYLYSQGEGVSANKPLALSLWRKGSSLGHLPAKRSLAWALLNGFGGFRGRIEGLLSILPVAFELARAKREGSALTFGNLSNAR